MAGKIFINYRRGDDPGNTGRLFDRLQDVFKPEQLFLDVDNIAPGLDFVRELNDRVAECDIVLAVIGRSWLDSRNAEGQRRLDDPDDFVRIEIESALKQGKRVIPVLVGEGQLPHAEDLPAPLQPLTRRNAVRLTHERFRADVAGLVKALQQSLEEIEARRQAEAEERRRREAEEERRQQEAEAARRAEEEAQRKRMEAEAAERAAEERRRHEAEAKQYAEQQRDFEAARRAGTVLALDAFLATNAQGAFVDEARKLRAVLSAREEAYARTSASNDPAVLKSFLATYSKGADVVEVRKRLRQIEAPSKQGALQQTTLIAAGIAAVVVMGAVLYFVERAPAPSQSAANLPAQQANAPAAPSPDQVTWDLLRDTTDDAALKRFMEEYPNSPLRKAAAARRAMLAADAEAKAKAAAAAEAEKTNAQAKAEAALKAQALAEADAAAKAAAAKAEADAEAKIAAANKALEEERARLAAQQASAGQQAAATPADSSQPTVTALSGPALVQQIKMELMRVGCYAGQLDDNWTSPEVKLSIAKFVKNASLDKMPEQATIDFLNSIRNKTSRVCPLECTKTQTISNGQCVAKTCPSGQSLNGDGDCVTPKDRTASRPPAAAAPSGGSDANVGQKAGGVGINCNKTGCHEHQLQVPPQGIPCKAAWQGKDGAWRCG